jgi:hypothetical protein
MIRFALVGLTTAALTLVSAAGANAAMTFNGVQINAMSFNGRLLNAMSYNGRFLNALSMNGKRLNAMTYNGTGEGGADNADAALLPQVQAIRLPSGEVIELR